jgi:hypothetical protein
MTAKNPDHYAVVIGIDAYPWLSSLGAARTDAARFAEWLLSEEGGGLPGENIKLILSPEKPTPNLLQVKPIERDVTGALEELILSAPPRRIGQRLYFYFAGHGVSPTFDDVGMLLADAKLSILGRNLGLAPCRQLFHNWGFFDEVVFVIDCCRGKMDIATGAFPFNFPNPPPNPPPRVSDCVILGAIWGESAFAFSENESADDRRGVLTQAVLEGLKGTSGALDPLGRVTAYTLREYVKKRVPELAAKRRLLQDPHISADQELVFLTLPADKLPTVKVQILTPRGVDGVVVLQEDRGDEIERRPASEATATRPWTVTLRCNMRYTVRYDRPNAPRSILDPMVDAPLFRVPIPQQ